MVSLPNLNAAALPLPAIDKMFKSYMSGVFNKFELQDPLFSLHYTLVDDLQFSDSIVRKTKQ